MLTGRCHFLTKMTNYDEIGSLRITTQRNRKLQLKNERFDWLLFQSFDFRHNKEVRFYGIKTNERRAMPVEKCWPDWPENVHWPDKPLSIHFNWPVHNFTGHRPAGQHLRESLPGFVGDQSIGNPTGHRTIDEYTAMITVIPWPTQ